MDEWHCLNLGDALLAAEPLHNIKALYEMEFGTDTTNHGAAIFVRHDSDARLHCDVWVYLPPALNAIARTLQAKRCPRPAPSGLNLLAGSRESWSIHFPERG